MGTNTRWTLKDIENLKVKKMSAVKVVKKVKIDPKGLSEIKSTLQLLKIPFVTEHRFHSTRKFRFDIAIMDHKVGIEFEGIMAAKSRHTTVTGYTMDTVKYNLAQIEGWKVLRYTVLNYTSFGNDILKIIS
jgi:hypothetical protein